ncbi:uncharacterized protein LOC130450845 isoform X2 [Diorhabda sublineata]|uniref:uncharacterized protein LOC130450845 isoform X2 n=1 Tax=Diorhabda sublineata TaxID=1163346 RepID=UPI0024E07B25|nr:uncharacterized protein LOC130450845 isoform X2 [Diorhabda sublineata]
MQEKGRISVKEKLALALRFMAPEETCFAIIRISQIVKEVLKHLKTVLVPIFMPIPKESDFRLISEGFWDKWQFPNCTGAIDGKHVRIRAPENNHNYKFIAVDVGPYSKEGDSGILQKSTMEKQIMKNEFNFPEPKNLPNSNIILPHFLDGDEILFHYGEQEGFRTATDLILE